MLDRSDRTVGCEHRAYVPHTRTVDPPRGRPCRSASRGSGKRRSVTPILMTPERPDRPRRPDRAGTGPRAALPDLRRLLWRKRRGLRVSGPGVEDHRQGQPSGVAARRCHPDRGSAPHRRRTARIRGSRAPRETASGTGAMGPAGRRSRRVSTSTVFPGSPVQGLQIQGSADAIVSGGSGNARIEILDNLISAPGIGINSWLTSDADWLIAGNTISHTGDSAHRHPRAPQQDRRQHDHGHRGRDLLRCARDLHRGPPTP